jgi:hypothetical protein
MEIPVARCLAAEERATVGVINSCRAGLHSMDRTVAGCLAAEKWVLVL